MAKAKTSKAVTVYRQAPAPVIRMTVPKPVKAPRRRSSGGGGGGGTGMEVLTGPAVAGGLLGVLKKTGMLDKVPAIPVVGRIGGTAILSYLWMRNGGGKLAKDLCLAATTIAAFQLGEKGEIDGEDE